MSNDDDAPKKRKAEALTPDEQLRLFERKQKSLRKATEPKEVTTLTWRQQFDCIKDWNPWKKHLMEDFTDKTAFQKWLVDQIIKNPLFIQAILVNDHTPWPGKIESLEDPLAIAAQTSLEEKKHVIWDVYAPLWQMECVRGLKMKEVKQRLRKKMKEQPKLRKLLKDRSDTQKLVESRVKAETQRQEMMEAVGLWCSANMPVKVHNDPKKKHLIKEVTTRFVRLEDNTKFEGAYISEEYWRFTEKCEDYFVLFDSVVMWRYTTERMLLPKIPCVFSKEIWEEKQKIAKHVKDWGTVMTIDSMKPCRHDHVAVQHKTPRDTGVYFKCVSFCPRNFKLRRDFVCAVSEVLFPRLQNSDLCRYILKFLK